MSMIDLAGKEPACTDKAEARNRFNQPIRAIELEWKLGEHNDHEFFLVISCGHSTSRKAFYALANVKSLKDGVWGYAPFDAVSLGTEHVARFNAKALRAYALRIRAEAMTNLAAGGGVLAPQLVWPPKSAAAIAA